MCRDHIGSSNCADTSISGQDDNGSESRFESPVEEGETFDIQHMNLIDEEHSRDKFSNTLVDVSVDNFVDFASEFLGHFGFFRFHDLTHKTHKIVSALRTSVGHIQIVKSDILNNFFLFVDISLRKRNVLFSFKIELTGI